jgi:hypothetical protein
MDFIDLRRKPNFGATASPSGQPTPPQAVTAAAQDTAGQGLNSCSCGLANASTNNLAKLKQQAAQKYPTQDCGPSPTAACLNYNQQQLVNQQNEVSATQSAYNAQLATTLTPADKQGLAYTTQLAQQMKALHPDAGGMTLSQIQQKYPTDFANAYAQLQTQFPFLKNIDANTVLAMSPQIAGMTLDQLIAQTSALSGAPVASTGLGLGILALAAGAAVLLFKSKD